MKLLCNRKSFSSVENNSLRCFSSLWWVLSLGVHENYFLFTRETGGSEEKIRDEPVDWCCDNSDFSFRAAESLLKQPFLKIIILHRKRRYQSDPIRNPILVLLTAVISVSFRRHSALFRSVPVFSNARKKVHTYMKITIFFLGINSPLSPCERWSPLPLFHCSKQINIHVQSVLHHCFGGKGSNYSRKSCLHSIIQTIISEFF